MPTISDVTAPKARAAKPIDGISMPPALDQPRYPTTIAHARKPNKTATRIHLPRLLIFASLYSRCAFSQVTGLRVKRECFNDLVDIGLEFCNRKRLFQIRSTVKMLIRVIGFSCVAGMLVLWLAASLVHFERADSCPTAGTRSFPRRSHCRRAEHAEQEARSASRSLPSRVAPPTGSRPLQGLLRRFSA